MGMINKIFFLLSLLILSSCERYVTEIKDLTLSGKYKLSLLDVTSVDQNVSRDSLYRPGTVYINRNLPKPFDSLVINRFYIHLDYATIRLNLIGVTPDGLDIWEYGNPTHPIFYRVINNNSYFNGFLQFNYTTQDLIRNMTFLIEDDGFESLQLQSAGLWAKGELGEKQVMTFVLTRVGP